MIEELIKRYQKAKGGRGIWESEWQQIAEYVVPRKSEVTVFRSKGAKRTEKLFDSTAIHSNDLLAASLQGTLTNTATLWFSLKTSDEKLNDDNEVKMWLDNVSRRMYQQFNASNFNSEIHELYIDLGSIGTGCLLVEEKERTEPGFNGFLFRALHISEFYIEEDYEGRVNEVFRRIRYTPRQCYDRWGDKVGDRIKGLVSSRPDEEIEILHVITPTKTGKHPIGSFYIDVEKKHVISEGGYHEFPCMVPRWTKDSGEKYGRSPSSTAMPDIRTLNKAVELELKAWSKDIDPPMIAPDEGLSAKLDLSARAVNYVRADLVDKIKPLESGHRYDVSQLKLEELRTSVRRMYFSDQLQLQNTPTMTATEAQIRYELMQRLLGPTLGRVESELLNPLINRCYNMMLRAGSFGIPPQALQGKNIDVVYVGPLARSQRLSEITAFRNWIETLSPLLAAKPGTLDNIDEDGAALALADFLGVSPRFIRDKKKVEAMRAQRAQAQQAEMEKADMERGAESVGKLKGVI